MDENLNVLNEEGGELKISDEVISTIAALAISEVKGLSLAVSVAEGIVEKFVKKNYSKAVKAVIDGTDLTIDVNVVAEYGIKIPSVAAALQEIIKKNVETMTNLTVVAININVVGISIEKPSKTEE